MLAPHLRLPFWQAELQIRLYPLRRHPRHHRLVHRTRRPTEVHLCSIFWNVRYHGISLHPDAPPRRLDLEQHGRKRQSGIRDGLYDRTWQLWEFGKQ